MPRHTVATFVYKAEVVPLEMLVSERIVLFAVVCPVCGTPSKLSRDHQAILNFSTKQITVMPDLRCPNSKCGWAVKVEGGVAVDLDPTPVSTGNRREEHWASMRNRVSRCDTCWGEFKQSFCKYKDCPECRKKKAGRVRRAG